MAFPAPYVFPERVFHYTSKKKLQGIMNTGIIWPSTKDTNW